MSRCGVFDARLRIVVFVGGFRHNSHGLDAGVGAGFNAGFSRLQLEGMPASFR